MDFDKLREQIKEKLSQVDSEYFEGLERKEKTFKNQIKRMYRKFGVDFSKIHPLIEKIVEKYNSSEYIGRWYKRGYEPECFLYDFLLAYAEKYGEKCTGKEWGMYGNPFTSEMYRLGFYYIGINHGQGSYIHVKKADLDKLTAGEKLYMISKKSTRTYKKSKYRQENRYWLNVSRKIAINVLVKVDDLGYTLEEFSNEIGVPHEVMKSIVTGKVEIDFKYLCKIQNYLNPGWI